MAEQPPPATYSERIEQFCVPVPLPDGTRAWLGPVLRSDREALAQEYLTLSEEAKWHRFLSAVPHLTPSMLDQLVDDVDGGNHVALVAFVETPGGVAPVGIGRIVRYEDQPDAADIALTVKDAFHNRGIATAMARELVELAPEGVTHLLTEVAADNPAPVAILGKLGEMRTLGTGEGVLDVEVDITGAGLPDREPEGGRLHPVLSAPWRRGMWLRDRVCDELGRMTRDDD